MDRCVWGCSIPAEVKNPASKRVDGAEQGVATSGIANFLAMVGILLVQELEDAEGSG